MNADERRSKELKELSALICVNLRPDIVLPAAHCHLVEQHWG
jgi:hypothetical protein